MNSQNNAQELPPDHQMEAPPLPDIGRGHPEYHFMKTALELQKSIIELTVAVNGMKSTLDSVKKNVDELMRWKSMIVGGAITIGFLIGLGFTLIKTMDNVTVSFSNPAQQSPPAQPK